MTSSEYHLDATRNPDVLAVADTELWARIYRPVENFRDERHPVLLFLHGAHATCRHRDDPLGAPSQDYVETGTCPETHEVIPNHAGYGYAAERLASWGYVVVSINSNRGVNAVVGPPEDPRLNLARGRLVLQHLVQLSKWNRAPGTTVKSIGIDLAGTLDLSQVGMMGHSRGGEGMRAAYNQYNDPGSPWPARIGERVGFRGLFEIAPTDGTTNRTLDARGIPWTVLLPMCDNDLVDLQGMKPFDRMLVSGDEATPSAKSIFAVWGANHSYYNTEWDSQEMFARCVGEGHAQLFEPTGGSAKQRETGLHGMMAFFRAHVGKDADPKWAQLLAPQYSLPESFANITRVERVYSEGRGRTLVVEDFSKPAGTGHDVVVTHGAVPEHDASLHAAAITWSAASSTTSFEVPFDALSVDDMTSLDFRVSRQEPPSEGARPNPIAPTNFSIVLVREDGTLSSPVKLGDHLELIDPVGGAFSPFHVMLETARIPLRSFGAANLGRVRGVKLVFDDTPTGAIYVTSIGFSRFPFDGLRRAPRRTGARERVEVATPAPRRIETGNRLVELRQASPSAPVEIEVFSETGFPVAAAAPRLRIGRDKETVTSRSGNDTRVLIFTMSARDFATSAEGAPLTVSYGSATSPTTVYAIGVLDKTQLVRAR